jgi:hypothetical protein
MESVAGVAEGELGVLSEVVVEVLSEVALDSVVDSVV